MDPSKLFELLKQPASILLALGFLGVAILALPERAAGFFGFTVLRDHYRPAVGLVTGICWFVGLVGFGKALIAKGSSNVKIFEAGKARLDALDSLAPRERFILAYCIWRQTNSLAFPVTDTAAASLVQKGLLIPAMGTINILARPHLVQKDIWEFIKDTPQIIASDEELRSLEREFEVFEREMHRYS